MRDSDFDKVIAVKNQNILSAKQKNIQLTD
jgi:hypothetical protein